MNNMLDYSMLLKQLPRRELKMKTIAGLWIDHRKAVIVIVSSESEEAMEILSHVEKQQGRIEGVRSTARYESQLVQADDRQEREFTAHLNQYYEKVIAAIITAGSILIFGPGEAKGELKKRLERAGFSGHILPIESSDKMTDHQISAKVRGLLHL